MTIDKLPKLLRDALQDNTYDVDVITKHLKLPWLKLDIELGTWSDDEIGQLQTSDDWRSQWRFKGLNENAYQVKDWNGKILFGPCDFEKFIDISGQESHDHDEDSKCRHHRHQLEYDWVQPSAVQERIESIIPREHLNLVNSYILPKGGYVFPHRDYAIDGMGLAKIYVAARWGDGNRFGMYGCGDIPIKQGDVILLNNYTLPHWVYNGSDTDRLVIDISADLRSPVISDSIVNAFKRTFTC